MNGASAPYLLGTEIPNAAVREKTQAIGTSWNVVWAFVTNFIIPYMINNIHFQVGWVFGSISILALVFTFFFLPETKVSSLAFFLTGQLDADVACLHVGSRLGGNRRHLPGTIQPFPLGYRQLHRCRETSW